MLSQWIADLQSSDLNVRHLAQQELQKLGPADREAVPALIAALQQAQREPGQWLWPLLYGVGALEAIGPDARRAAAGFPQDWMGESAARAILRIGAETSEERLAVRFLLQWHPGGIAVSMTASSWMLWWMGMIRNCCNCCGNTPTR
jgi:hypothetical protein